MKMVHAGLIVSNLETASYFYEHMLGLTPITRPDLNFKGIWYGLEAEQQLHLMQLDNPYQHCNKPSHGGRDNHLAMQVDDLDSIISRLETGHIPYSKSKSGRTALFCRDPDGNTIELIA